MEKTKQLNGEVPAALRDELHAVSKESGVRMKRIVTDAVELYAGIADRDAVRRMRVVREMIRRRRNLRNLAA